MSEKKTSDSYEVGYGKPPKNTQFQKGVSGNPRGRPKKALDFDHELLRESKSFITINENGQRRRISKLQGIVKQLINIAMTGNIPAARIYLASLPTSTREGRSVSRLPTQELRKYDDVRNLTDEELMRIVAAGLKKTEQ